jgi:hypothetical protein
VLSPITLDETEDGKEEVELAIWVPEPVAEEAIVPEEAVEPATVDDSAAVDEPVLRIAVAEAGEVAVELIVGGTVGVSANEEYMTVISSRSLRLTSLVKKTWSKRTSAAPPPVHCTSNLR